LLQNIDFCHILLHFVDIECNSLDKLLCVMNMKICESRQ